jgi:hypothetical protein
VSAVGRKGCPNPRTEACSDDATRPPGALLEKPIENGNREETRDVLHGVPSGENREKNIQRRHRCFTRKYHRLNIGGAVSSLRERSSSRGRLTESQTKIEVTRKTSARRQRTGWRNRRWRRAARERERSEELTARDPRPAAAQMLRARAAAARFGTDETLARRLTRPRRKRYPSTKEIAPAAPFGSEQKT